MVQQPKIKPLRPRWHDLTQLNDVLGFYQDELWVAALKSQSAYDAVSAKMAEEDLFFLITEVLNRHDLEHQWLFERCREVQAEPDGCIDLWAREHYKSTIITFGYSFFDIIHDPEVTIGIFSHNRPIAKAFLRQIKEEQEQNERLPRLWPHIFWKDPKNQSPKWSEDEGITVKRKKNPKEQTVEAWGLVDSQPTSKHFKVLLYDDVVVQESVSTPEQILKTTASWELSDNLGAQGGVKRTIGTRYHLFDTYRIMIDRGVGKVRKYAATHNGKEPSEGGKPVLFTPASLLLKRIAQGPYTFGCQMLLNPVADQAMGFKEDWKRTLVVTREQAKTTMNIYLICDPASGKNAKAKVRKDPDYTSMWVIGAGADENFYILDGIRDRLNLGQRTKALIGLHRKWRPKDVGYEEYGMQADIEHIEGVQADQTYLFNITTLGGNIPKNDRIKALIPKFEQGKFIFPNKLLFKDHRNYIVDLVKIFFEEEYNAFPVLKHDDMLDCLARILDPALGVVFPDPETPVEGQALDYQSIEEAQAEGDKDWRMA